MSCFKADILIINESKLDSTFHYNELYLSGFEIVRRDRLRIRDDLNINDNLQCLFVEISMPRSTGFMVRTKYRPPGTPIELFNGFEKFLDKIDAENNELYLLGDVNCNLLPEAKRLIDLCITNSQVKVLGLFTLVLVIIPVF